MKREALWNEIRNERTVESVPKMLCPIPDLIPNLPHKPVLIILVHLFFDWIIAIIVHEDADNAQNAEDEEDGEEEDSKKEGMSSSKILNQVMPPAWWT